MTTSSIVKKSQVQKSSFHISHDKWEDRTTRKKKAVSSKNWWLFRHDDQQKPSQKVLRRSITKFPEQNSKEDHRNRFHDEICYIKYITGC